MNKEKSNIMQHFLTIGIGTILNMIIGIITTPILTRIIDPGELGQMSIFSTYSSIVSMILCCGLDQSLFRFFYVKENIGYKRGLIRFCFLFSTLTSMLSFILVYLSINLGIQFEFSNTIMFLLCIHITTTIWDRISAYVLRLDYRSKEYATCNVLRRLSYLLFTIIPAFLIKSHYLYILMASSILSVFITFLYAVFWSKELWCFRQAERIENRMEIIKFGMPLTVSMSLATLFQAIDRLSINTFCTYSDVGVYSSAQTIISVFSIIQTTFNAVWLPMQIEHYTKNPNDTGLFQKGNQYITVIMFVLGIILIAAKDIIVYFLGVKYWAASTVIPFLAFEPIMYTISETTHVGIGYSKKSYITIVISGLSCLVNFTGNQVLIPQIGIKGAAISTGVSYIVFWGARTFFSNHYLYVDYKIRKLLLILAFTLLYAYICTFFSSWVFIVVGFIICNAALFMLYRETIEQMLDDFFTQVKSIRCNGGKND